MNKYAIKKGQESLYDLLKENSYGHEKEVCFKFYSYKESEENITTLTRGELLDKSLSVGNLLKKNNIRKDDKIIIFSTNTSDNVLAMLGATLCGATFTLVLPPDDEAKCDRFISVVNSFEPKFILCTEELGTKVQGIINNLIDKRICVEYLRALKIINIDNAEDSDGFIPEEISLDHIVNIQYSSGSTSEPKGIMLSYGNILSDINLRNNIAISEIYGGWLSFSHIIGFILGVMYPVCIKEASSNIMSPADFVEEPYRWFKMLNDTKSEVTVAPNSIYESYPEMVSAEKVKSLDLSNIKKILSASECASYETMRKFSGAYGDIGLTIDKFYIGYGLSENTGGISETSSEVRVSPTESRISLLSLNPDSYLQGKVIMADEKSEKKIECISNGYIWADTMVKIINPGTFKECEKDEMGEIWVQSPAKAQGYYKNEEATKETFMAQLDGCPGYFLRTGDLGVIYNKELYITGRIKELIIINGKNILPNDIVFKIKENVHELTGCTMAVFSVMCKKKEQLIIVTEKPEDESIDFRSITEQIKACVLKYFALAPSKIGFVNKGSIPKTESGKTSVVKAKKLYEQNEFDFINSIFEENDKIQEDMNIIERKVADILEEYYSYKISKTANILNEGMNSIDVVKLSNIIQNKFDIDLPVKFIFSSPTIEKISLYIEKYLSGDEVALSEEDSTYLYDEAVLPEDIVIKEYEEDGLAFKNIFLTGATGFLGAYLIRELIKADAEKVYCHVRCKTEKEGFERIKKNMEYYKLWKDEYSKFIVPVPGHLEQDLLGIDKKTYDFLCENIDVIYHNGAVLNFIYPYETLKNINVKGTISALEMACTGRMKYYNYISSYSVYMNSSHFGKLALEDDEFEDCNGYPLAYTESKWVCERIIRKARAKGLRASIYRPGDISGSVETGIWKYSDMVSRIIKSILKYGTYPKWDKNIYMTPVDYIAEAIINISKEDDNYNKAYNIINNNYLSIEKIAGFIKECGYNLKKTSYAEFKDTLVKSDMEHPLKPLESLFKYDSESFSENDESMSIIYDTSNVQKALKGTGIVCPDINADIIKKYIENFK